MASGSPSTYNQPGVREAIVKPGREPAPSTPEAFAKVFLGDMERWCAMVKSLGIKAH